MFSAGISTSMPASGVPARAELASSGILFVGRLDGPVKRHCQVPSNAMFISVVDEDIHAR